MANRYDVSHTHDEAFNEKFTGKKKKEFTDSQV